jgi:hypothetical protein
VDPLLVDDSHVVADISPESREAVRDFIRVLPEWLRCHDRNVMFRFRDGSSQEFESGQSYSRKENTHILEAKNSRRPLQGVYRTGLRSHYGRKARRYRQVQSVARVVVNVCLQSSRERLESRQWGERRSPHRASIRFGTQQIAS